MKRSLVLMLIVPFLWALNFVLGKVLIDILPPFSIASGRFTVAGFIFIIWILIKHKRLPQADMSFYFNLVIIGFTGVFAFNSVLYIGIKYTTVVNATIINSFNPIATMILAGIILQEKVSGPQYLGAAMSITGVFLVISCGHAGVFDGFNTGDIIILINTFIWALFSVLGKKAMQVMSPLDTIAFTTLIGLPFLWLASAIEVHVYNLTSLPWNAVIIFIFLGVFASTLGFVWWYEGIREFGASGAAAFYNLIPLYSLIISYIYLGEKVYAYQLIGGLLIIGGVLMSLTTWKKTNVFK